MSAFRRDIAVTGTVTSVASVATATTIKAANERRKGITVFNTDANVLYLLLGTGTASATNFTTSVATNTYFAIPFGYTGIVSGIWAVDGTGAALVTEFT